MSIGKATKGPMLYSLPHNHQADTMKYMLHGDYGSISRSQDDVERLQEEAARHLEERRRRIEKDLSYYMSETIRMSDLLATIERLHPGLTDNARNYAAVKRQMDSVAKRS